MLLHMTFSQTTRPFYDSPVPLLRGDRTDRARTTGSRDTVKGFERFLRWMYKGPSE